jgi:CTP synthase (UTP-ammonia lyase)
MNDVTPPSAPSIMPVASNVDLLQTLRGAGTYLGNLVSTIFGAGAQATQSSADYAEKVKASIDPVISEIGRTAEQVRTLSFLGALLDRKGATGVRKIYDISQSILDGTHTYKTVGSRELSASIASIRKSPTGLLTDFLTRDLPEKMDAARQYVPPSKKKKGKSKGLRKPYRPPVKKSRGRRK